MNEQDLTLAGISAVPLIIGLTEVAKLYIPARYAALVALALGLAAGIATQATLPHPVWINGVVMGIAVGLSAAGLFSGVDHLTKDDPAPADPAPAAPASA